MTRQSRTAEHIDMLMAEIERLTERAERAEALNAEWAKKAETWLASPEAAQRLEGYRELASRLEQAEAELAKANETLRFVERWANHHAQKPRITPREVLSVIQHYPPILDITRSYVDGKVPETPNPWAELDALRALLRRARPFLEPDVRRGPSYGNWCALIEDIDAAMRDN